MYMTSVYNPNQNEMRTHQQTKPNTSKMACLPPTTTTHHHHQQSLLVANSLTNSTLSPIFLSSSGNHTSTSPMHLQRPFLPYRVNHIPSRRCFASSSGPPPPPPNQESEPPFNENPSPPTGVEATLSRFQDRVQIFFAVFFWMSLFFWACAWDGREDGRPNKGSRFRR